MFRINSNFNTFNLQNLRTLQQTLKLTLSTQILNNEKDLSEAAPPAESEKDSNKNIAKTTHFSEKDKLYKKLEIELRGTDPAVLKSYSWFATTAANHLGIKVGKCWAERLPLHDRMTLLKSAFVHKKHRVQYEMRTYYRFMEFHKITGSTLDTYLEYIERKLPEGVALIATKTEIQQLPDYLQNISKDG